MYVLSVLEGFLVSDISSYRSEHMAPSVTALYNLFFSTLVYLDLLNVVIITNGHKYAKLVSS